MEPERAKLARHKRELRGRLSRARRNHPREAWNAIANAARSHLEQSDAFRSATSIALYAALPDELPTRPLFDAAREAGKRLLFPRCGKARLEFAAIESWEELRPGRYGVPEPAPDAPAEALESLGLVLVPGLAFDVEGRRLGRGAGWYDRTFASSLGSGIVVTLFVGVAAGFQIVEHVPSGEEDRVMDGVLSEDGLLWRPKRSEATR